MSRASFVLFAVLVGLAAFVAAEHDASDLLFKSVSELDAPEVVSHQRALLAGRVLAATYPPPPPAAGSSSKYTVTVQAKNSLWKNRVAVANALRAAIQSAIPKDTLTRKIKPVLVSSGTPQVASKGLETFWVYTVKVYYIEKPTLSPAEISYNNGLKANARAKITGFKESSRKVRTGTKTTKTAVYGNVPVTQRVAIRNKQGKITGYRNVPVTQRVAIRNKQGKITGYRNVVKTVRKIIRYNVVNTPVFTTYYTNRGIVATAITKTWY